MLEKKICTHKNDFIFHVTELRLKNFPCTARRCQLVSQLSKDGALHLMMDNLFLMGYVTVGKMDLIISLRAEQIPSRKLLDKYADGAGRPYSDVQIDFYGK
jgi:hypothetical protein